MVCRVAANAFYNADRTVITAIVPLLQAYYCNVTYPIDFCNLKIQYTINSASSGSWIITLVDRNGNPVERDTQITFTSGPDPNLNNIIMASSSSIQVKDVTSYGSFLKTARAFVSRNISGLYGCISFELYYQDTDGQPQLNSFVLFLDLEPPSSSHIEPQYIVDWQLTPYSEFDGSALAKFSIRNLPPPPPINPIPTPPTSARLATSLANRNQSAPIANQITNVPNPQARITATITTTPDGSNITSIDYSIFDIYAYELTGSILKTVPNLPTYVTYRSDFTVDNADYRFFGPTIWILGTTLGSQLVALDNYSCLSQFTQINLISYALAKYVLAAIMYGKFDTVYLAQSFNYQFMIDLANSRFAAFVELFEDPTYGIVGFDIYFR